MQKSKISRSSIVKTYVLHLGTSPQFLPTSVWSQENLPTYDSLKHSHKLLIYMDNRPLSHAPELLWRNHKITES